MIKKDADIQIQCQSPELSAAIKYCRVERNWSIVDLGKKIHKSALFVSELEQSKIAMSNEILELCAGAFELSVADLVEIALAEKAQLVRR